jgi:hypothetical protein
MRTAVVAEHWARAVIVEKYDEFHGALDKFFCEGKGDAILKLAEKTVAPFGGFLFDG